MQTLSRQFPASKPLKDESTLLGLSGLPAWNHKAAIVFLVLWSLLWAGVSLHAQQTAITGESTVQDRQAGDVEWGLEGYDG